ncbi:unnamed protein product [Blepharisma stoltei]|uniref:Rhodanese domain-containing protein n=1 Tax=Blepharisma stoltei TaxID=1481888 RepID=A0AAU9J1P2_9CILI|nr:unnamed protein product [Blepharisma stoltei]
MNPFTTLPEDNLKNYLFIYCGPESCSVTEYLENSWVFYIKEDVDEFLEDIKRIRADKNRPIVLYDIGDDKSATQVFWSLKAAGFEKVKVLIGGSETLKNCEIEFVSGDPPQIKLAESPQFDLNYNLICTAQEFIKKNTTNCQLLNANIIAFDYHNPQGELIPKNQLLNIFEFNGIKFEKNKDIIAYGYQAPLLGALLLYLGETKVSVILDTSRSSTTIRRSFAMTNKSNFYSVAQTEYFDAEDQNIDILSTTDPSEQHYMIPRMTQKQSKDPEGHRDSTSCSSCSLL